ncbi:MAG: hypothetical protein RB296_06895 [Acidobacteriota bacterium]|jgi:hypothetical protein|nr:hypothetical protein [Acidobacteriota bacterium]
MHIRIRHMHIEFTTEISRDGMPDQTASKYEYTLHVQPPFRDARIFAPASYIVAKADVCFNRLSRGKR